MSKRVMDSLPRQTVKKTLARLMPAGCEIGKGLEPMIYECTNEFFALVSAQAQLLCINQSKTTITVEHFKQALRDLRLHRYVSVAEGARHSFEKSRSDKRERKNTQRNKFTEEELLQQQKELFEQAKMHQSKHAALLNSGQEISLVAANTTQEVADDDDDLDFT